jgi:hypothetical protein
MINKIMFKQVQTFKRQGYSKSAIVKALEMDPRTVAKYFAMEEEAYRAYRREHLFRDKAFDDLRGEILEVYEANGFRRLQVSSVYDYLDEKYGVLPGNEQALRNYVAFLIKTDSLRLDENVRLYTKVPQLPFGQQMQADFGRSLQVRGFSGATVSDPGCHPSSFRQFRLFRRPAGGVGNRPGPVDGGQRKRRGTSSILQILKPLSMNRSFVSMFAGGPILRPRARWKTW